MATELISDRGRGPEITGTRITVYNLLPYFLDDSITEEEICQTYDLTSEQVAAARAYVLNNADTVLAEHLKIEARMAAGNPPEVIERAKQTHNTLLEFKAWLAEREAAAALEKTESPLSEEGPTGEDRFPTFREWLREQKSVKP